MRKISFNTNNNGMIELAQEEHDRGVVLNIYHSFSDYATNRINIPACDMVMLANFYKYVKENDIQNDFINPNGQRREK